MPIRDLLHKHFTTSPSDLINTSLQRGVRGGGRLGNRLNGFPHGAKTVETVFRPTPLTITPLKRGVNERRRADRSHFSALCGFGRVAALAAGLILTGCSKKNEAGDGTTPQAASKKIVEIKVKGSDTMVQLAQAWSEAY